MQEEWISKHEGEFKAIILAAGRGQRLHPHTARLPKCLLPFAGDSILHRQLKILRACRVHSIAIVKGFLGELIDVAPTIRFYVNPEYAKTNMLASLFCAEDELDGNVLICYGD